MSGVMCRTFLKAHTNTNVEWVSHMHGGWVIAVSHFTLKAYTRSTCWTAPTLTKQINLLEVGRLLGFHEMKSDENYILNWHVTVLAYKYYENLMTNVWNRTRNDEKLNNRNNIWLKPVFISIRFCNYLSSISYSLTCIKVGSLSVGQFKHPLKTC